MGRLITVLVIASLAILISFNVDALVVIPQARVLSLSSPSNVFEGSSVALSATVQNTGNVYLGPECYVEFRAGGPSVYRTVGTRQCNLTIGASGVYSVNYFVPEDGVYSYSVAVRMANTGSSITDLTPWFTQSFRAFEKLPAASVLELSDVGRSDEGTIVNLKAHVRNAGATNLGTDCSVQFWVWGGGLDQVVGSLPCHLETGQSKVFTFPFITRRGGSYTYYVAVLFRRPDGSTYYLTPWSSRSFYVIEKVPAASVLELLDVGRPDEGTPINLKAHVRNVGNTYLGSECMVQFWMWGGGLDQLVGSLPCHLEASQSRVFTLPFITRGGGSYTYYVAVLFRRPDGSTYYLAPWSSRSFYVVEKVPAASVLELSDVSGAFSGEKVDLNAHVRNVGNIHLGSDCFVQFWVWGGGLDQVVGSLPCYLEAGQSRVFTLPFITRGGGSYTYYVAVLFRRPDGSTYYLTPWVSRSFNVAERVPAAGVLTLSDVDDAVVGNIVHLKAEVKNTGTADLGADCTVQFWVWGGGLNQVVGSPPCYLSPGSSGWFDLQFIPQKGGAYTYYVAVSFRRPDGSTYYLTPWSSHSFTVR